MHVPQAREGHGRALARLFFAITIAAAVGITAAVLTPTAGADTEAQAEGAEAQAENGEEGDEGAEAQAGDSEPSEAEGASQTQQASGNLRLVFDNAYSMRAAHPTTLYWRSGKGMRYRFEIGGQAKRRVRIAVIHKSTGRVVQRYVRDVVPGRRYNVIWRGLTNGNLARGGRYVFRVTDAQTRQGANRSGSDGRRFFFFRTHRFPVRGGVSWGDGWGAGRGHRGQDLFANCGRPILAARAGKVVWKAFQGSGAGYYLVIRGARNNRDYVYMHLRKRRPVKVGQSVRTGQRIGRMGATGNASGCHLHFELWKGQWYNGGRALRSVTKALRNWASFR